ncbi:hypothetical protein VIW49_10820 [Enterobacter bugandensis]|uniref:hypothetical protein n=1 Tax=Enterobacter bugandensis TaxID=881260 RepID=UPI002DB9889D|nr:hypothetical protein [Enterobacter bugandensis]WRU12270.1 hypothetical protein VIW49_10820 [Enterobacter bugandensis]
MLANARQFMPVRIAQIGNIKVGAVGGSCTGHAFIFPTRTEARCMEASDNVRVICSESEHCPVSRRRGLLVKRRTNAEAKFVIRMIFVSPHCPAISPGGQTCIAQHVKNSVIKVHGALKVICPNRDKASTLNILFSVILNRDYRKVAIFITTQARIIGMPQLDASAIKNVG